MDETKPFALSSRTGRSRRIAWLLAALARLDIAALAQDRPKRPIDGIMDGSFFVKAAYNQEEGVVQNILTGMCSFEKFSGAGSRQLELSFTQE